MAIINHRHLIGYNETHSQLTLIINPLRLNFKFACVPPVPISFQNGGVANCGDNSCNSLRHILLDEATIQGNINCAVVNKDVGQFSHDLKLSRARLDEKDRKIGM